MLVGHENVLFQASGDPGDIPQKGELLLLKGDKRLPLVIAELVEPGLDHRHLCLASVHLVVQLAFHAVSACLPDLAHHDDRGSEGGLAREDEVEQGQRVRSHGKARPIALTTSQSPNRADCPMTNRPELTRPVMWSAVNCPRQRRSCSVSLTLRVVVRL